MGQSELGTRHLDGYARVSFSRRHRRLTGVSPLRSLNHSE
jgi:hypothetical protein